MKTSKAFRDKDPPEEVDAEDAEAMKAFKFPWHCEKGLVENSLKLNEEFNEARTLNPVKVFITGPPASGKSFYANRIEEYYNIPRVHISQLTEKAFGYTKFEEGNEPEEGTIEGDCNAKIGELRGARIEELQAKRDEENEGKEDVEELPPIDAEYLLEHGLDIRIPEDLLYRMLRTRLCENDCRNRGYILDGFPRSHNDA